MSKSLVKKVLALVEEGLSDAGKKSATSKGKCPILSQQPVNNTARSISRQEA